MGGNAFENLSKLNKKEYRKVKNRIEKLFLSKYGRIGYCMKFTNGFSDKEEYSDVDICVYVDPAYIETNDFIDFLKSISYQNQITKQNPVSIVHKFKEKLFQIDCIITDDIIEFEFMKDLYDYNIINYVFGLTARAYGLKLSKDGLYLEKRFDDSTVSRTKIINKPEEMFKIFGYNYDDYVSNDFTKTELFDYASSGSAFNYTYISNHLKPHDTPPLMGEFLNWVKENKPDILNHELCEYTKSYIQRYTDPEEVYKRIKPEINMRKQDLYEVLLNEYTNKSNLKDMKKIENTALRYINKILECISIRSVNSGIKIGDCCISNKSRVVVADHCKDIFKFQDYEFGFHINLSVDCKRIEFVRAYDIKVYNENSNYREYIDYLYNKIIDEYEFIECMELHPDDVKYAFLSKLSNMKLC